MQRLTTHCQSAGDPPASARPWWFGIRHSPFRVSRFAFRAPRSAFGVRRSALGVRRSAFGARRLAFGVPRSALRARRLPSGNALLRSCDIRNRTCYAAAPASQPERTVHRARSVLLPSSSAHPLARHTASMQLKARAPRTAPAIKPEHLEEELPEPSESNFIPLSRVRHQLLKRPQG
jgi:hypothetical protein